MSCLFFDNKIKMSIFLRIKHQIIFSKSTQFTRINLVLKGFLLKTRFDMYFSVELSFN